MGLTANDIALPRQISAGVVSPTVPALLQNVLYQISFNNMIVAGLTERVMPAEPEDKYSTYRSKLDIERSRRYLTVRCGHNSSRRGSQPLPGEWAELRRTPIDRCG